MTEAFGLGHRAVIPPVVSTRTVCLDQPAFARTSVRVLCPRPILGLLGKLVLIAIGEKGGNVLGHRDEAQELPSNDTWIAFQKHTVINAGALFRGQARLNAVRRERRRIVRRPPHRREDRAIGGCPARSCRRLPTVKKSLPARTRNSNGQAVRIPSPRFVIGGFAPAPREQVPNGAPPLVLGPRPQNICSARNLGAHLQTFCWLKGLLRERRALPTSGRDRTP